MVLVDEHNQVQQAARPRIDAVAHSKETSDDRPMPRQATIMAGIPAHNMALYHRIRFSVGDPAVLIELAGAGDSRRPTLILRDIEMERARAHARVDRWPVPPSSRRPGACPGDRETATAQAAAEFLRRSRMSRE